MPTTIQTIKITGTPTKKTLPVEVVERLALGPITLRKSLSDLSHTVIGQHTSSSPWLQCLIDRYVNAQAEHWKHCGFNIEASELDEFTLHRQREINFLVNQLQPRINPNNDPLKVYYFGAGGDYIEVAAATNASKLILTELGFFNVNDPVRLAGLAQPHHEDVTQAIKWIGGQIIDREVNIQEPEYIPCEDDEIKSIVDKLIEAGILKLSEGEALTVELQVNDRLSELVEEGNKREISILRVSNEVFLSSGGCAFAIKEPKSSKEKRQIGIIKFGIGEINLRCQVPIFTVTPGEKLQEITYHSGFDADASIPEELKQGYDVLWAKETYILKDTLTKQRLYELLRPGGKAVFTTCKSRTIKDLKTDFPMFNFDNSVTIPIPDSDFSYIIVEK